MLHELQLPKKSKIFSFLGKTGNSERTRTAHANAALVFLEYILVITDDCIYSAILRYSTNILSHSEQCIVCELLEKSTTDSKIAIKLLSKGEILSINISFSRKRGKTHNESYERERLKTNLILNVKRKCQERNKILKTSCTGGAQTYKIQQVTLQYQECPREYQKYSKRS